MASEKFNDGQTFHESLDPITETPITNARQEIYASETPPDEEFPEDDDAVVPLDEVLEEGSDEPEPEIGSDSEIEAKTGPAQTFPPGTTLPADLLAAVEVLNAPEDDKADVEHNPEQASVERTPEIPADESIRADKVSDSEQEPTDDRAAVPVAENAGTEPLTLEEASLEQGLDEADELRPEQPPESVPSALEQEPDALTDDSVAATAELPGPEVAHAEVVSEGSELAVDATDTIVAPDLPEPESRVETEEVTEPVPEEEATELPGIEVLQDQKGSFEEFKELTDSLNFTDIAKPNGERPIAKPERFSFTPLMSDDPTMYKSMTPVGSLSVVDENIKCTYGPDRDRKPYMDTRQAIGLVYKDHLVAVAGAGIEEGRLKIIQIQDVTGLRKEDSGREFYKTGLHQGFNWRDALVTAWEEVGRTVGVEQIAIQSSRNSTWPQIQKAGYPGYDGVAKRLGYKLEHDTLDWVKTLSGADSTEAESEPESVSAPAEKSAPEVETEPEAEVSHGVLGALRKIVGLGKSSDDK